MPVTCRTSGGRTGASRSTGSNHNDPRPARSRGRAGIFFERTERWDARGAVNAPPLASQVRFLSGAPANEDTQRRWRPTGPGTGLLNRPEWVRAPPAARDTRVPSFAGEAPGSYPDEQGSIPWGLTQRNAMKKGDDHAALFQLWRPVSPRDRPLSPTGRADLRTVHAELRRLAEGSHAPPLARARLLRRGGDQHQADPEDGLGFAFIGLKGISRRDGLMGSRLFREQEIAGSTPAAPTRSFVQWQGRCPTNSRSGFDSLSSDQIETRSPIGGREPAFEAGDVGSIPARGALWWPWCTGVHASL